MAARRYSGTEIIAGLFLAFCIGLFVAMLVVYSRMSGLGGSRQQLAVYFENIGGLRPDSPVRYNGYEIGRVKYVRSTRVTDEVLERFGRPFTRADVDNLPLRGDGARKKLLEVADAEFDSAARKTMLNQTMIEVGLEVQNDDDSQRFRVDDQVRIASTVFGDASVEIASGSGALNSADKPRILLGNTGDFFSNLARSMGDVKEILGSVTDVVGTAERRSFERASGRLSGISSNLEKMAGTANRRSELTAKRMDLLGDEVKQSMGRLDTVLADLQPQAKKTGENLKGALKSVQAQFDGVKEEANNAVDEVKRDAEAIRTDLKAAMKTVEPDLQATRDNLRAVYDRASGLSDRFDAMSAEAGETAARTEPEIPRITSSLKNILTNLKQTGEAGNLNKDLMLSRSDTGEYEYFSAVEAYRKLTFATRQIRGAAAEVQLTEQVLREQLAGNAVIGLARQTGESLKNVHDPLEQTRGRMEELMLPPFERKKAGWKQAVVKE